MRVMVLVKATPSSEAGILPDPQLFADMDKFNQALVAAGVMKAGEGLKPSSKGVRVRFSGTSRTVTDGPFAETRELVAGFWLWEVSSLQEAVDWVKRCPNPMVEDSEIEVRPLYEIEDFAPMDPTGDLARSERELASTMANMSQDEARIRHMMHEWSRALEARNLDGMMQHYAEDVVLFDAIPPYKKQGVPSIRALWATCLPHFPQRFTSEHRDIRVHVAGDAAFVHCLHHITPLPPAPADHPAGQTWLRATMGLRRVGGAWKIVHEHASVPFNPMNNQVWMIPDPAVLDAPEYAGGCAKQ